MGGEFGAVKFGVQRVLVGCKVCFVVEMCVALQMFLMILGARTFRVRVHVEDESSKSASRKLGKCDSELRWIPPPIISDSCKGGEIPLRADFPKWVICESVKWSSNWAVKAQSFSMRSPLCLEGPKLLRKFGAGSPGPVFGLASGNYSGQLLLS